MAKKKQNLTPEELLEQALVPEHEWPYKVPENWVWVYLTKGFAECLDRYRKPVNSRERSNRVGDIPYYGATGQVGWIDDFLTEEHLVLVGEDGAPFFDYIKDKSYIIQGKAWVNNHAHILRSYYGENGNKYLMHYLNIFNYVGYVNGTTRLKLTQNSMDKIPIPLPPLAEQKRIVDRTESLFEKLDQAKGLITDALESFENRKASILHKAFSGELTKKWREENGVGMESWEDTELGEEVSKLGDGLHGTPKYSENGKFYFINGNNFNRTCIEIKTDTKKVDSEEFKKYRKNINENTVFVSINGTLGKTAFYNGEPIILGKSACYFNVEKQLDKRFIRYYMETKDFFNYANTMATGSTIKNLSLKAMRALPLSLPTIDEQVEIVNALDNILDKELKSHELISLNDELDLIKKSILARAFRGELGTNNPKEGKCSVLNIR